MPYTPPSQQSPATSRLASPEFTRNHSISNLHSSPPRSPGLNLPRSNSSSDYLTRSRRSPSLQSNGSLSKADYSRAISENIQKQSLSINTAVRQSPPPSTDAAVPAGMIVSPPDSTQNSSDDDEPARKDDRHVENLAELEEAVRRSLSPQGTRKPTFDPPAADGSQDTGKDTSEQHKSQDVNTPPPRLTSQARKISHSRSTTESSFFHFNNSNPINQSDGSDEEEDLTDRPPLLRKKSGELVKPAIRPSSRRKHSSMPGTPTFSKAVHFNDNIEQVKHFLQVDRPIAVSAGGSPVEGLEEDSEFPFGFGPPQSSTLEMNLTNFPRDSLERMSQPVRVEKLRLSDDQKSLLGSIVVANLSFHKLVIARFTFDYWKTTSEVVAEYNNDVRQQPRTDGFDQFNFSIKLSDHQNLESKTFLLCVRYSVNGQDYWDNNNSMNYQAEFKLTPNKNAKPANTLGARPIPRSRHNSAASNNNNRPRSMPSFDDFFAGSNETNPFELRRNAAKPFIPDAPPQKKSTATQPFAGRYDFGASLTAALNQAQATLGDRSGLPSTPDASHPEPAADPSKPNTAPVIRSGLAAPSSSGTESPRPDALLANRQSVDSKAYQDFVNKFCFFGTGKPTSNLSSAQPPSSNDGTQDERLFNGPAHSTENLYVHNSSSDYPFPTTAPAVKGLSPSQSGYSSPSMSTGLGLRSPSPVSHGYPYHQGSNIFSADAQTQSVHG